MAEIATARLVVLEARRYDEMRSAMAAAGRLLRHGARRLVEHCDHVDASLLESEAGRLALILAGIESEGGAR